jgi:hypothetical protein
MLLTGRADLARGMAQWRSRKSSGRQALAAFRASRGQHPAAAWRGHSRAEAMAALADELAGLVSALHGTGSNGDCLG